jgi:hypothetical protein
MNTLQAEANIVINAKAEREAFNERIQASIDHDRKVMLEDLHARCEAKKNAIREARFWDMINEEVQASFEY